jgi:hypothetical protein
MGKDETYMKKIPLRDPSQFQRPYFYEPPNWIILFGVKPRDMELLNLGKHKFFLLTWELVGLRSFLLDWDFRYFKNVYIIL